MFVQQGECLTSTNGMKQARIPFSKDIVLSIYSDIRPPTGLIDGIQKGLVLVQNGRELIGEGSGFGVPVALYREKTYFPGSSTLQVLRQRDCTISVKQFTLNMVPEKWFRKARLENTAQRKLSNQIADLYRKHEPVRHTFETLKLKNLSRSIGVHTNFVKSKPIGSVNVTYHIKPPIVHVKADFKPLEKSSLRKISLLNEQSSQYFDKYWDSNGTVLHREKIGAWERVTADWACVSHNGGGISFRLWQVKGAVLRRGREFLNGALDWVGLDYEVDANKTCFEYDIEIVGGEKTQ
jgi:hypothetical protein